MQGWRKSMEDAHVARTDVPLPVAVIDGGGESGEGGSETSASPTHAKVFAVFDGHGGAEVARFCSVHLVPTLTSNSYWTGKAEYDTSVGSCVGHALIESFHALDRMIDDPEWRPEIEKWRTSRPPPFASAGVQVVEDSLGRPQSDENDASTSEEIDLDADAAAFAEDAAKLLAKLKGGGGGELLAILKGGGGGDADVVSLTAGDELATDNGFVGGEEGGGTGEVTMGTETTNTPSLIVDDDEDDDTDDEIFEDSLSEQVNDTADELENKVSDGVVLDDSDDEKEEEQPTNDNEGKNGEVGATAAAPSTTVGGGGCKGTMVLSANDAVALFQKLLRMNGTDEGDVDDDDDDDSAINGGEKMNGGSVKGALSNMGNGGEADELVIPTKAQLLNPPTGIVAQSASVPTRVQNGRKICNLPDHPVHAGCTSIVVVIVGRTLVVANAGDSRAVLCRAGGLTEPLSFDHKPLQNREMNRITNAGGFVNQFGRVNGNLNLSRSIGDLKYKQVPGISPAEQMITAEPDIICTTLRAGDEFIVLGCDGIWDCLSNEECVKYVRDRINYKHPREIGKEMLDTIVSTDPRASQGIGGDNMTIVIVDLLPNCRPYGNQ